MNKKMIGPKNLAQRWRRVETAPLDLPISSEHRIEAPFSEESGPFLLKGLGANASQLFPLEEGLNRVGRHEDNDVVLDSRWVGRFHAQLWLEEGVVTLRDLRSINGSFVNGERVKHATLACSSALRFGDVAFLLLREGDEAESWDRAFTPLSRFFPFSPTRRRG